MLIANRQWNQALATRSLSRPSANNSTSSSRSEALAPFQIARPTLPSRKKSMLVKTIWLHLRLQQCLWPAISSSIKTMAISLWPRHQSPAIKRSSGSSSLQWTKRKLLPSRKESSSRCELPTQWNLSCSQQPPVGSKSVKSRKVLTVLERPQMKLIRRLWLKERKAQVHLAMRQSQSSKAQTLLEPRRYKSPRKELKIGASSATLWDLVKAQPKRIPTKPWHSRQVLGLLWMGKSRQKCLERQCKAPGLSCHAQSPHLTTLVIRHALLRRLWLWITRLRWGTVCGHRLQRASTNRANFKHLAGIRSQSPPSQSTRPAGMKKTCHLLLSAQILNMKSPYETLRLSSQLSRACKLAETTCSQLTIKLKKSRRSSSRKSVMSFKSATYCASHCNPAPSVAKSILTPCTRVKANFKSQSAHLQIKKPFVKRPLRG